MAKKISVFREHDVNYLKDYLVEAVREVLNEASPPNMKLGAGTDLEQAIVDALNGKSPKHFQDFVLAAAEDIKNRLAPQATPATKLENGTISSNWKKWGGADTTSKADVQFGKDGVSMKMGPDAMLFGFGPGDAQACMQAAIMTPNLQSGPKAQALLVKLGEMQQAIGRAPLSVLKRAKEMEADLAQTASADDALDKAARSIGAGDEGYVMDPAARAGLKKQIAKAKKGDAAAFNRIKKGIEKGQLALSNGSTGPEAAANYNLGDTLIAASDASKKTKKDADYKTKFDPKMQQKEAMDGINTIEQLMSHAEEILNLEKTLQEIEKEVVALLDPTGNDDLRLAFFKEALTGEQKFGKGSENVATHVYITQGSKQLASAMTGNRSKDLLNDERLSFFNGRIQKILDQYISLYPELKFVNPFSLTELRLKRWQPGNYFDNWHSEHSLESPHRILNFMIYLTDHNCGTEFLDKTKILSKTGRLVIMPSYFTHTHRGMICPEGKDRYILSGYFNFMET